MKSPHNEPTQRWRAAGRHEPSGAVRCRQGRIETFKRTSKCPKADYDLLVWVFGGFKKVYTVAHVLAEVSNLTDLSGPERQQARRFLREIISRLVEFEMTSARAAEDRLYQDLGLADAAIGAVARTYNCHVLTDDLDLYLQLSRDQVSVVNFTHLRECSWRIR